MKGVGHFFLFLSIIFFFSSADTHFKEDFAETGKVECPEEVQVFCLEDEELSLPDNHQLLLGEGHPDAIRGHAHMRFQRQFVLGCAGDVSFSISLYLENDPVPIQILPFTGVQNAGSTIELSFNTKESADEEIRVNGLPYNNPLCTAGEDPAHHRFVWTIYNACGELIECSEKVRIVDCMSPQIKDDYIWFALDTVPSQLHFTIHAMDFGPESIDDRDPKSELIFSFSEDVYAPNAIFTCDCSEVTLEYDGQPCYDGGVNCQEQFLQRLWVADKGVDINCDGVITWEERNKSLYVTLIYWEYQNYYCGYIEPNHITPAVFPSGNPIPNVSITRYRKDAPPQEICSATSSSSCLILHCTLMEGDTLRPFKEDSAKNGVNAIDIIRILEHIQGTNVFDNPFQIIASDVTNSGSVTTLDLIEIRKLLIGNIDEFTRVPAWRFIDKEFEFPDPMNPFPFPEEIHLEHSNVYRGFIGVKMGDVNNSVNFQNIDTLNDFKLLTLSIANEKITKANQISVPIFCTTSEELIGIQFTIEHPGLELISITNGLLDLPEESYFNKDQKTSLLWYDNKPLSIEDHIPLFYINFNSTVNGNLYDYFNITSSGAQAEAYEADKSIRPVVLDLLNKNPQIEDARTIVSVSPNPFSSEFTIEFFLDKADLVILEMHSLSGRKIWSEEGLLTKGAHKFTVDGKVFPAPGVYVYTLVSGGDLKVGKLVKVD